MSNTLIILSGGADPLHKGHVELIEKASKFGDVCFILNTDEWLTNKKGKPFMCLEERMKIMSSLRLVKHVVPQIDTDTTVCETIKRIVTYNPLDTDFDLVCKTEKGRDHYQAYLFGNGGDRAKLNTPEVDTCIELGVGLVWGLGDKIQSSSDLIKNAQEKQ